MLGFAITYLMPLCTELKDKDESDPKYAKMKDLGSYSDYDCFRGGFCGADGFNSGFYVSDTAASSGCGTDVGTQSGSLWVGGRNSSQVIQSVVPGPYILPPCEEDPSNLVDTSDLTQFQNGTVADADEVNANFTAIKAGIDACLANSNYGGNQGVCEAAGGTWSGGICTAATCDVTINDDAIYDSGYAAGVISVDIRTDNGALCTSAGGTYDSGTNTCTVDITTDN